MSPPDLAGLLVATLGGTAIGLERQWSGHAEGPAARFAGIRTFTMLGALAGISGWLWTTGAAALAAILLAGAVAIIGIAYVAASRQEIDGTTEVAALVVLAAGVLAGMGVLGLASGIIAIESLLLVEKSRLHAMVERIDGIDLRAGIRFAVMALVVLPLLPEGPFGPLGGIRPRMLWALVLFFSGLSFVGHLSRRGLGPARGTFVSGVAGGMVSSTNVTWTFARLSRVDPPLSRALAFGSIGANVVLYPRVIAAASVLNPSLAGPLVLLLAPPALVALIVAIIGAREATTGPSSAHDKITTRNPLQLSSALQMAALFQCVMIGVTVARGMWGAAGVLTTAAVLGLTDVDALTVSMARDTGPGASVEGAALAIAVGVLANTLMKTSIAVVVGAPRFRAIVGGTLALMAAVAAAAIWFR